MLAQLCTFTLKIIELYALKERLHENNNGYYILSIYSVFKNSKKVFMYVLLYNLHNNPVGWYSYYYHFTDGKSKGWNDQVFLSESHS